MVSPVQKVALRLEGKGERKPPPALGPWEVPVVGGSWLLQQCRCLSGVQVLEPELTLQELTEVLGPLASRETRQLHSETVSLFEGQQTLQATSKRTHLPNSCLFSSCPMVQEIHHLPTHCQMPCLDRGAPNTPQTMLADQTSASKPVQTRAETRRKPDLPQLSHHTQTGLPVPSLSHRFSSQNSSLLPVQGVGGKAGAAAGSHTTEERAKVELRNPRQGDSASSKARNIKPAPRHCSAQAGWRQRGPACFSPPGLEPGQGKQRSRPPGSQLLMGSEALGPLSQTTPASNPGTTRSETSPTRQETAAMTEKHTTLKLDSLSTSLTCYSCSLQLLKASVS